MKTSLGSRSLALLSVVVASFAIGAVACAAPPVQNDLGDDNTTTKDPKSDDNSAALPNNTKSDNNAPTPTPTPTPAATPAPTPTTPPVTPPPPPVDPNANACQNLATCCDQLVSDSAYFACTAVTFANKPSVCATSLIACKADVALGGSGGFDPGVGQSCIDDFDCPGDLLCDNNLCHE